MKNPNFKINMKIKEIVFLKYIFFVSVFAIFGAPTFAGAAVGDMTTYTLPKNKPAYNIAFDRTNMWVTTYIGQAVVKISPQGDMTTYSAADSPFFPPPQSVKMMPMGIAFDGTNMWTTTIDGTYSVTKISPQGVSTVYVGTGGINWDIAFDGTNMWTVNNNTNSVTKISPQGTMTTYTGTGIDPESIAFDGTNMWTANLSSDSVTKISPQGTMTTYTGTGVSPYDIAFDGTNMWTANYSGKSVTKISPQGTMTTYNGIGATPIGIAFDGTNMWTANYAANSVTRISPQGDMTSYVGTELYPKSIAFDGASMWVTNYTTDKVTKIEAISTGTISVSSNVASSWTITGPETITGTGVLQSLVSKPTGIYTIIWNDVPGYVTPATQSLTLTQGGSISFAGNYTIPLNCGTVQDADGNTYDTIVIGTQCWMKENLRTTKKPDGTNLTEGNGMYSNPAGFGSPWGRFYNWTTAVNISSSYDRTDWNGVTASGAEIQGICPNGWHLPSDFYNPETLYNPGTLDDWGILFNFLGGDAVAGGKMKSTDLAYWTAPNDGASNNSGFSGVASGFWESASNTFRFRGTYDYFWSSAENGYANAWDYYLRNNQIALSKNFNDKKDGASIRCIKNSACVLPKAPFVCFNPVPACPLTTGNASCVDSCSNSVDISNCPNCTAKTISCSNFDKFKSNWQEVAP
jgi:uncharacterized protein (TIGR02145 family)